MKKLTAGIFTVLMGLVSVNAADAAVASKGYVTQEINKVNTKVGTVAFTADSIKEQTNLTGAVEKLAGDLSSLSGGQGSVADQISNALKEVTATVTGEEKGVVTGVTQENGKVTATRALITNDNIAGDAAIAVSKINGLGSLATKSEVAETDLADALATKINGKQDAALVNSNEEVTNSSAQYPSVAYTETLINASKTDLSDSKQDKFVAGDFLEFTTDDEGNSVLETTYTGEANVVSISSTGEIGVAASGITTAKIADGNVTKAKLDSDVQASLDLADSALQESDLTDTGVVGAKIKANADAIEDLKDADTTINGKIGGEFTAENTVAKAIEAASSAAADAQADADALEVLVGNTAVGTQIDTKIAALALKKISQVPAQCSEPTKYCALTYGTDGFVWEVIERGDDEVLGYGEDAGRIDSNVDAAEGE